MYMILETAERTALDTLATVGIVAAVFCSIALILAILILVVSKVCKIDSDEKMEQIIEKLAGANCGGCGCSGCAGFAEKLCGGAASLSDCHVTSPESKKEIAALLGIKMEKEEKTVACVMCNGGTHAHDKYEYSGLPVCTFEAQLFNGSKTCESGCMGFGSCVNECPEHAIDFKDGVANINPNICISCGLCINKCPKNLIKRIPFTAPVYVACSTHCKGKDVIKQCESGCIGCGLCAKFCPSGAITMTDNLPVIDFKKCTGCYTCVAKCPRKVIKKRYE